MILSRNETWARRFFSASPVLLICVLFLLLAGCATYMIEDVTLSLPTIKSIVTKKLPRGLRKESMNGRYLYSGYFTPNNRYEDATNLNERAYAEVLIVGSTRPYRLDVHVYREKKNKGSGRYSSLGNDKKLAQELADEIRAALADRREDRNIIDDFRAF